MIRSLLALVFISVYALAPAVAADVDAAAFCRKMFVRIFFNKYALIANQEASVHSVNHFEAISYDALNTHFFKVEDRIGMFQRARDPHGIYLQGIGLSENATLSPSKIFAAVDARVKNRIARGELSAEDALIPARVYQLKNGETKVLKLGDFVPSTATVYPGLLPPRDYWKMLADGHFPLGGGDAVVTTAGRDVGNDFFHDLSHFSGLDRDLEYQKALRSVAQKISVMSDETLDQNYHRVYFVSESLSAFPKGSEEKLQRFIKSLRGTDSDRVFNRREYASFLEKKTDGELRDLWSRAQAEIPNMQPLGGTASDKLLRVSDRTFEQVAPFEYSFEGGPKVGELMKKFKRSQMIDALSQRLTMVDYLRNTTSADMVHDMVANRRSSPTMRLLCENQEMWTGAHMMAKICN